VQVTWLVAVVVRGTTTGDGDGGGGGGVGDRRRVAQQLREATHARDAHDVDVVGAAEGLQQREVDLQRHVALVLLVRSQHAQNHAVRVAAGGRGREN